jgi:2-polyprenyl-3-methyl-5-hydroxy-6-metoxy-1,4-benzoquinol methylase
LEKKIEVLFRRVAGGSYEAERYLDLKKVDKFLTPVMARNSVIVDVGAGLCLDIIYFVGSYYAYGVAIDLSKRDMIIGKSWSKELGIKDRIDFCVANALNLPFYDGTIDLVVSYSAIEHLPVKESIQKWVNEMSRITVETGSVVLTTSNKLWPMNPLVDILRKITGWPPSEFQFDPHELKNMIEKAGLRPAAFNGRGLYYYQLIPKSRHLNLAVGKIINLFQDFPCFKVICARIGFFAIKKRN